MMPHLKWFNGVVNECILCFAISAYVFTYFQILSY